MGGPAYNRRGNPRGNDIPQEDSYGHHKAYQKRWHKMSFLNETPAARRVVNGERKLPEKLNKSIEWWFILLSGQTAANELISSVIVSLFSTNNTVFLQSRATEC